MTIAERLSQLVAIYGSVRAVGRALGIDHVYLHRLASGKKNSPSPRVLRQLGLRRVVTVTYESAHEFPGGSARNET